jgi:fructokinase
MIRPDTPAGSRKAWGDDAVDVRCRKPVVVGAVTVETEIDGAENRADAALNVVWHLAELGLNPLLVTRVGDDGPGRSVLRCLRDWGLDTEGIQIDPTLPTLDDRAGRPDGGEGRCAYDALTSVEAAKAITPHAPAMVYQAPTAVRSETALAVVTHIQTATGAPFFVDLDLDATWLTARDVRRVLLGAKWLRIPADHLDDMVRPTAGPTRGSSDQVTAARAIQRSYALEAVIVDQRGLPSLAVAGDEIVRGSPRYIDPSALPPRIRDAVASALVAGFLAGLPISLALPRAVKHAMTVTRDRTRRNRESKTIESSGGVRDHNDDQGARE